MRNIVALLLGSSLLSAFPVQAGTFEQYPNADIGILNFEREVWVDASGQSREQVREKRMLLNARGKESFSEVQWPYDTDNQTISIHEAKTIEPEGEILPVRANAIKDSAPFADYPAYDRTKIKTFTFPGITPGAITDYTLEIANHKGSAMQDFSDSFLFHSGDPTESSRYVLHFPKGTPLRYRIINPTPKIPIDFKIEEEATGLRYEWQARNLPHIPEEDLMPNWEDLMPRVIVSTAASWEECAKWYLELNQGHADATPEVKALAERLTKGLTTQTEKARAIFHWILNNVRYVSVSMNEAGYEAQSNGEVLRNRYGDCKDGSTLLLAMLRAVGIPAYYTLLATNENAKVIEEIPSLTQFDHCIVAAYPDGRRVFLDSVGKTSRFGVLPEMDQGTKALILDPKKPTFAEIPLAKQTDDFSEQISTITLDAQGGLKAKIQGRFGGEEESTQREYFQEKNEEEIKASFLEDALRDTNGSRLLSYSTSNAEDLEHPFHYDYSYQSKEGAFQADKILIFHVPGLAFSMESFEHPTRIHPIKPLVGREVEKGTIKLPKGFKVRFLPKAIALKTPFVTFNGAYRKEGNLIFFEATTEYQGIPLASSDYSKVRALFSQRASFGRNPILLEKTHS